MIQLIEISVKDCSSFEHAVKLLKSKVKKEHIIEDYRKHLRYEKPSDAARKAKVEARKRARKLQRLREL